MILPIWYTLLWIAVTSAWACLCVLLVSRGELRRWPSLFACGGFEVISFITVIRLVYPHPYKSFFWVTWLLTGLSALPRTWLALDILRSIPGYKIVPRRERYAWLFAGIAAAVLFSWHEGFQASPHHFNVLMISLNRCEIFAGAIVLLLCSFGAFKVGYGFTLTGIRVATGMALQLLASMASATIYASHASTAIKTLTDTSTQLLGLCVAVYWCFTITRARRNDIEFRNDWTANRSHLLPSTERDESLCTLTH